MTLNPGHGMNYHSHERRDEVWTVVSGSGRVGIDGVTREESLVDLLLIERPVKFRFGGNTGFPVEKIVDEFVGDIFRKRVCQFVAFPETFQEIVDCSFPTATTCCYGTTAETVHVVKPQYFLVVH